MPKIRTRSSKPNHAGGYSQGRKLEKARNHEHKLRRFTKLNGREMERCTVPRYKELHYVT